MKSSKKTHFFIALVIVLVIVIGFIEFKVTYPIKEATTDITPSKTYTMSIDTTFNLYVFQPSFSRIELKTGTMPSTENDSIAFCAAAAYTKSILDTFSIDNIIGGHVACGQPHNIDTTPDHYGRFVCKDDYWQFIEIEDVATVDSIIKEGGSMFTQHWVIKNSNIYLGNKRTASNYYRALCEKNDTLMIAQSKKPIPFRIFAKALKAYKMENALYMDMGSGWNHSFYRDSDNQIHILFKRPDEYYCTNWITIYK